MKILWIKSDFLHPTTRGGQIRTLEMLRRLHRAHEIHYVAFDDPAEPEGPARAGEYCTRAYPIRHVPPRKGSPVFYGQLAGNLFSSLPAVIARQKSRKMTDLIGELTAREGFDAVVCDFLSPSINVPRLGDAVLFQHNVETMIWGRRAQHVSGMAQRLYMRLQANRMFDYERRVCRAARRVIAVSSADAGTMRRMFGLAEVPYVPTGVDVANFSPPEPRPAAERDLVFVGSMDWTPNIDCMERFAGEILPLIRERKPDCSLAIVGRTPPRSIRQLAEQDRLIAVTGTVADVRPYLWSSRVAIVPLRIGGGTRLKIYEAMAAGVPVVSTEVGAEGLDVHPPDDIRIADSAEEFAAECLELLADETARRRLAAAAYTLVSTRFSWERVIADFELLLA